MYEKEIKMLREELDTLKSLTNPMQVEAQLQKLTKFANENFVLTQRVRELEN
jgi:hypothetical protein